MSEEHGLSRFDWVVAVDNKQPHGGLLLLWDDLVSECPQMLVQLG